MKGTRLTCNLEILDCRKTKWRLKDTNARNPIFV
jgi:hypothetical protein